jgi:hypothetical protein
MVALRLLYRSAFIWDIGLEVGKTPTCLIKGRLDNNGVSLLNLAIYSNIIE